MIGVTKVPVEQLPLPWPGHQGIVTYLVRLDALHPHYGGNKWFKLKHNLERARREGHRRILTFGGAYSNHLRATAAAAKELGFELVCAVRGERAEPLNNVLQFVESTGAQLHFVSRSDYRLKESTAVIDRLLHRFGPAFVIPEGGANVEGVLGSAEVVSVIAEPFDTVVCACGTFTTLAGLSLGISPRQEAIGINVLKADGYGERQLEKLLGQTQNSLGEQSQRRGNVRVVDGFHFGGYAKSSVALVTFIDWFQTHFNTPLDFVYTGKLLYGVKRMIEANGFKPGSRIAVLYSNAVPLAD